MHILTLNATLRSLTFHAFRDGTDEPVLESELTLGQFDRSQSPFPQDVFQRVHNALEDIGLPPPDVIALRALFGGEQFPQPVFVNESVLIQLESLLPSCAAACAACDRTGQVDVRCIS